MEWLERVNDGETAAPTTRVKTFSRELEQAKDEAIPVIEKEAKRGQMPINPIHFRPVKSPGIYEAEFAAKDKDLIFHFWPYGYHQAERDGRAAPHFHSNFAKYLEAVMDNVFSTNRVVVELDKDMGAWFVRARNWGDHQYMSELAIQACEALHKVLGGV